MSETEQSPQNKGMCPHGNFPVSCSACAQERGGPKDESRNHDVEPADPEKVRALEEKVLAADARVIDLRARESKHRQQAYEAQPHFHGLEQDNPAHAVDRASLKDSRAANEQVANDLHRQVEIAEEASRQALRELEQAGGGRGDFQSRRTERRSSYSAGKNL